MPPPRPVQVPQPPLRPPVNPVTPSVPSLPRSASDTPEPETTVEPAASEEAEDISAPGAFPKPGEPDAAADELQRLAALAMQQLPPEEEAAPASPEPEPETMSSTSSTDPTGALPSAEIVPGASESSLLMSPATAQPRAFGGRTITAPMPPVGAPAEPAAEAPVAAPEIAAGESGENGGEASMALNLNNCTPDELLKIPGCTRLLADSIVRYRAKSGSFKKLEDLLEVPGMNNAAYSALTGEAPPQSGVSQSLADLLGFPAEQKVTLKDVTDRIGCWPDVTGCVLSQKSGLHLVGHVPGGFDRSAIVAFAPKMFDAINKSFGEIAGKETDELIIPATGTSFHIFRSHDLYLIILCRLPQMPDRHAKIARLVLAGLSLRPNGT
jgi:competence ComEA-like helix-hairpin-helix protein